MKNRVTIITDSEDESEALEELAEVLKTSEVSIREFLSILSGLDFSSLYGYSGPEDEEEKINKLRKIYLNFP